MLVLGIESSCDETAAAVLKDGRELLSNVISTQIPIHTLYGGVVPEIASRNHIERISRVVEKSLTDANVSLDDIDVVGVTYGPGLVGPLLVGVSFAKAMAYAADKPFIGINHMNGHISANYIENHDLKPPFISLVVSGGHTTLVKVKDYGEYEVIGRSVDDAAGEAFDKVARAIGLSYPGGPKIEEKAKKGDENAIHFPIAEIKNRPYDFSFSGLKSAVLNYLNSEKMKGNEISIENVAASFQKNVVTSLTKRVEMALNEFNIKEFALCGGVSANSAIRDAMDEMCQKKGIKFYVPSKILCTDNGAMIAAATYYEYKKGKRSDLNLNAIPNLDF